MVTCQIFSLIPSLLLFQFLLPLHHVIISLWLCNFPSKLATIKAHFSAFAFKAYCSLLLQPKKLKHTPCFLITPFILEFHCSYCHQISREYESKQSGLPVACSADTIYKLLQNHRLKTFWILFTQTLHVLKE